MRPPEEMSKEPPAPDQHSADVLVVEAELDLLEGALDEERRERVHDRAHPGERQAGADVEQQLLADADVDHPVGVPAFDVAEELPADLGVHQGDRQVLGRPRSCRGPGETLVVDPVARLLLHLRDHHGRSPPRAVPTGPVSRSARGRGRRRHAACQPSCAEPPGDALGRRRRRPPARPVVRRGVVVDHDHGQIVEPDGAPASSVASWLLPSSSSASPTSTTTREASPWARSPRAMPTASGSP